MRKEDRIHQQQNPSEQQQPQQTQSRPGEKAKGSVADDRPTRPPRESGKLPLPD